MTKTSTKTLKEISMLDPRRFLVSAGPSRGRIALVAGLTGALLAMISCAHNGEGDAAAARERAPIRLTILATADFHGAFAPGRDRRSGRPAGGAAFLAARVRAEKAHDPEGTVLLDAGDLLQGGAIANLTEGRAVVELANLLGNDAAAIGNHEFDLSADALKARLAESRFPWLAANVFEDATHRPLDGTRPFVLLKRRGLRIAVIGLTTQSTVETGVPKRVASYRFENPGEAARRLLEELLPARADVAILLTHIGAFPSRGSDGFTGELVELVDALGELPAAIRGSVAVVGGHTHQRIAQEIDGIPVLQPGASGRFLGRMGLDIVRGNLGGGGRIVASELDILPIFADEGEGDAAAAALVARHQEAVAPILDEVLGEAAMELDRVLGQESRLGNLLTDVIRETFDVELVFQNMLGVRRPIDAGPIRYGEVFDALPFDNTVVLLKLSGVEVDALLEQAGRRQRFLYVSGLRYVLDLNAPEGERVEIEGGLDAQREYTVAVNDFLAEGGDGLTLLKEQGGYRNTGRLLRDVLADAIRAETAAGRAVKAEHDGRIRVVAEGGGGVPPGGR
jgi:5'-nucleotidase/UDP-sugar diphosphatase